MSVCLTMIVRDEAAVIERCIASVLPHIDSWLICDTGSKDGTQDVIRDALTDVPGELHERPWRDFGTNRSESLRLARGRAEWLLIVDADEIVRGAGLEPDGAGAYMLSVEAAGHRWWSPRLLRDALDWRYEGACHSLPVSDHDVRAERIEGLSIYHYGDGGSHANRRERNRALLAQAIARDPSDTRSTFYLAQELRDDGELAGALAMYERRAAMGGWLEEVFYSLYQAGLLADKLGDWPRAQELLARAWRVHPTRIEPLHALAHGFRIRGEWRAGYGWAIQGVGVEPPADALFVAEWVYAWGLYRELAPLARQVGDLATVQLCAERMRRR